MMRSDSYDRDEKMKADADAELAPTHSNIVGDVHDVEYAEGTHRGLKSRHAQMIALGGTIGTGLFVGSGQGLRIGGPVFFFLGYCLITLLVFGIVCPCALKATFCVTVLIVAALGHCYHRNELLSARPWIDNGLLWDQIFFQIDGLRFGLDVLVHLYNHRTSRNHCSQFGCAVLESTRQRGCVDNYLYDCDHSIELLPGEILRGDGILVCFTQGHRHPGTPYHGYCPNLRWWA